MENKRFGKNKERSYDKKGGRRSFSSSSYSSGEENRKQGDVRGSGKRFGSNRKSFGRDSRPGRDFSSKERDFDRDSSPRDSRSERNFSSRGNSYKKDSFSGDRRSDRNTYSKDKRSGRSSFNRKDDNEYTEKRTSGYSSKRYNKGGYREDREERSFEKKDRYSKDRRDSKRYDDRRSSDKYEDRKDSRRNDDRRSSDKYEDRRDSRSADRRGKISVRRRDEGDFSDKKFRADRETLQKRHYSKKKQLEHKLKNPHQEDGFRLNRYIANSGVCSRREADRLIEEGRITVNGKVVIEVGTKVKLTDTVKADGKSLNPEKKVYVLLNKPKDFVTTAADPMGRKTVMDLIKDACKERVFPVGRLDRMTSGLLLFTNDGDLAKKLTHPKYDKKKIYHAFLDKDLTKSDMIRIAEGFELEDGFIQADEISYVDNIKNQIGIEIHSGKNRIVRRIFEHLGYNVDKLDRVYFAGLTKKNIPRGKWRMLTEKEISMLKSY